MSEREPSRPIAKNGGPDEDIEIIDVADILEDEPETPEIADAGASTEPRDGERPAGPNPDPPLVEEDVFRILEEGDDEDEEIIDLVDRADEDESIAFEGAGDEALDEVTPAADRIADADLYAELEDDFISAFDLEEILGADPQAPGGGDLPEGAAGSAGEGELDFIDALDLDLNLKGSPPLAPEPAQDAEAVAEPALPAAPAAAGTGPEINLSEQQVEAALERVIRKMYADKIDAILVEAIEKTVSREIGRLKTLLNQGAPDL